MHRHKQHELEEPSEEAEECVELLSENEVSSKEEDLQQPLNKTDKQFTPNGSMRVQRREAVIQVGEETKKTQEACEIILHINIQQLSLELLTNTCACVR